jgi:hypothetical protein
MTSSKGTAKASLADSLKPPGGSLFLRSVGRSTRPAWGNRFVKDFYDLDYDLPDPLAKLASRRARRGQAGCGSESVSSGKTLERASGTRHNPEKIAVREGGSEALGLCPFEHQNTIEGKMARRSNHHLSFEKSRVERSLNENPVFYDRRRDIDLTRSEVVE